MGFLDKLWDETLAGPMPDSGLGKLRKYDSFPAKRSLPTTAHRHHVYIDNDNDKVMITRSIKILKSNSGFRSVESGSSPGSPSTPGTPLSPGTPGGDFKTFVRRKSSADG